MPAVGRIVDAARRVPGAAVLAPMGAGAAITAVAGGHTAIGPFTRGLSGGAVSMVALLLVCVGAQITPASLRPVASRTGVVLAGATLIPGAAALAYAMTAGRSGIGGVSALAVAAAAVSTSNALWISLARRYGAGPMDAWGGSVASVLNSAPVVPMLIVAACAGRPQLPWCGILDALAPLAIGVVLGQVLPACRAALAGAVPVLVAGMSFGLGTRLDLRGAGSQLPAGLALGAAIAVLSGGLVAAGWRLVLHQPATVGWAAGACTVTAPLMPAIIAGSDPTWTPLVPAATAQVAAALVLSTLAAPALTAAAHAWATHHHPARLAARTRVRTGIRPVPSPAGARAAHSVSGLIPIDRTP